MAGWSLWIDDAGRPSYTYNCFGHDITTIRADVALSPGRHEIRVLYVHDGGFGAGGTFRLFVDDAEVARATVERTVPVIFSMSGETFDVGTDTGSPVGPYPHDYACTATIETVTLERLGEPDAKTRKEMLEGEFRAGMSTQ